MVLFREFFVSRTRTTIEHNTLKLYTTNYNIMYL